MPANGYLEIEDLINQVHCADCIDFMKQIADCKIDTIITDPPYGLNFMGKDWDKFKGGHNTGGGDTGRDTPYARNRVAPSWHQYGPEEMRNLQEFSYRWATEALRVIKPGGIMLCFGGTRTFHRIACGIEDAGWEIRDTLMWVYGCLSEDTEILTTEGWKNYQEIEKQDCVFSFNILEGIIEKDFVEDIFVHEHEGTMVNLKNDNTDQLLTLTHKVISKESYEVQVENERGWHHPQNWFWHYAYQMKLNNQYYLPLGAVYNGYLSIGVDEASLLGWILSEGYFHTDTEAISIYQSSVNKEKVEIIRDLLNRMKIRYSEYKRERQYKDRKYTEHQFYFSDKIVSWIKKWIPDKKPINKLWHISYNEKIALFNALMLGDGSKGRNGKYIAFYQYDIDFLEWFQVLCHLIGKQARINPNKMCVSVHHNPSTQLQYKHLKDRFQNYKGIVWSIQTSNMSYIARRNGKIFITGNSGFPKSHNIGKAVEKEKVGGIKNLKKIGTKKGIKVETGTQGFSYSKEYVAGKCMGGKQISGDIPVYEINNKWKNYGTALKPAYEPIIMAMKPKDGTYAENALKWDVAGLNIDNARIETPDIEELEKARDNFEKNQPHRHTNTGQNFLASEELKATHGVGRFPANLILEDCEEVEACFPDTKSGWTDKDNQQGRSKFNIGNTDGNKYGKHYSDNSGSASRYFKRIKYCAKASKEERNRGINKEDFQNSGRWNKGGEFQEIVKKGNYHPCVKPVELLEYLVELTKMPNKDQIYLDPFLGSGSTAIAICNKNRNYIGIEKNEEYCEIARARIKESRRQLQLF